MSIYLIGPTGAGKTTIGKAIAQIVDKPFYDLDHAIEEKCGVDIDWIFSIEGEAGFRRRERAMLQQLTQLNNIVLATGAGIVVDAQNRELLQSRGIVVYLQISLEQQARRLARDKRRPMLQQGNLNATLQRMKKEREPWYESLADYTFDIEQGSSRQIARAIVNQLMKRDYVS